MKRIIFIVITVLIALNALGQNRPTMHAIIFADTYDDKIGIGADISKAKFSGFLLAIAGEIDYEDDIKYCTGDKCCKATLMNVLDSFHCDTADIVIFCYLGHGVRSVADTSIFPQMCLHEKYEKDFVPLEYVKTRLASCGARVTLVIGDCCNAYSENVKSKEPKDIEAADATMLPGAATNLIDQLFVKFTGVVTMCATKPGTFGWCNRTTGMYFNNALIQAIQYPSINNIIRNRPWTSVMNIVMMNLAGQTFYDINDPLRKPYKMEPRYKIEKRYKPTTSKPKQHVNKEPTLQRSLSAVANRNKHHIERTRLIPNIEQSYFASNAIVRTVSQENIAYGTPYAIDDYLNHLAQSENIINVVVCESKRDSSGKIIYMEVHEYYSELKK